MKAHSYDQTEADNHLNQEHHQPLTNGYDLTPFQPDEQQQQQQQQLDEDNENGEQHPNPHDDQEEKEEESLLQSGGCEDQLARIELYNSRIVDSDSEEEEDEEEVQVQDAEEEEDMENDDEYAGLDNDAEDGELSEVDDDGFGHVKIPSMQSVNIVEQFDAEPSSLWQELSSTDVGETGNVEKLCMAKMDDDKIVNPLSSSPLLVKEEVKKEDSFSKAVPLLKPPPAEKMQAYLLSKGIAGDDNLFSANFDDGVEQISNRHVESFGFESVSNRIEAAPFTDDGDANTFFKDQALEFEGNPSRSDYTAIENDDNAFVPFETFEAFAQED